MIESIKVEVGHQFGFYMINRFSQCFDEFIEVFFVKKDLMTIIPIVIKALSAFCNCQVVIITPGGSYIKEIGPALSSTNSFAVNAFHFVFVILVRHS
jgi:hypothetical protein